MSIKTNAYTNYSTRSALLVKTLVFKFINPFKGSLLRQPKGRKAKRRINKERRWLRSYRIMRYRSLEELKQIALEKERRYEEIDRFNKRRQQTKQTIHSQFFVSEKKKKEKMKLLLFAVGLLLASILFILFDKMIKA